MTVESPCSPSSLSIIVPSVNGIACLRRCIGALRSQIVAGDEVIVIDSTLENAAQQLEPFPGLVIHTSAGQAGVPQLRSIGVSKASNSIVALTEDHCIPHYNWCSEIRRMHREHPESVIGGSIENASKASLLDWACYFCEYADFMPPLELAPGGPVPGTNVSYKRPLVDGNRELFLEGLWDYFLHQKLAARGATFRMEPRMQVLNAKSFTCAQFEDQSFRFARSFAAMRMLGASRLQIWKWRLLSPTLPLLRTARHVRKLLAIKRRHLREFFGSLGWVIWFQCWWSLGEMVGYWKGDFSKQHVQTTGNRA